MTGRDNNSLEASALMARAGKTFFQAARLLPRSVRSHVVALYAFCRTVDDLADDAAAPVQQRKASLLALAQALEEGAPETLSALGWPFACTGRMPQAAALLVHAALGDLEQQQPATERDVLQYAFGVAGTVGLLMAEVLCADPAGFPAAVALGMAMQCSNIARDVAEDFHQGRVYLPQELVATTEVGAAIAGTDPLARQRTAAATLHLLAKAEGLYELAFDGMWALPFRIRWSILAAAMCYRQIGRKVARNVARSWKRRTVVGASHKLLLILLAAARLAQPRFWRRRSSTATGWHVLGLRHLALQPWTSPAEVLR